MERVKKYISGIDAVALAWIAGLAIGFLLQNEFADAISSVDTGALLIQLMVVPTILIFAVVSNIESRTKSEIPARMFVAITGGFQVGVIILAWRILTHWYANPENSHMEPMFVATGVSLAVLEWCRSKLKNL